MLEAILYVHSSTETSVTLVLSALVEPAEWDCEFFFDAQGYSFVWVAALVDAGGGKSRP